MKSLCLRLFVVLCLFTCPFLLFAQLPSYLPADGLVAWYPFNGNANDESGNGNDGVVNGATLCADHWANESSAYDFSGFGAYIEVATSPIQLQGSLIAWIFPRSAAAVDNNWNNSASLIDQNFDLQNNSGVALYYNNPQHGIYAQVGWSGDNNNFINANPIEPLALNNWQQVVFTFVQNSCSLYLNGELIATRTNMNAPSMSTANLFFGRAPWGGNQFDGKLDDIAIYNRALTQAEVTALYTAAATNNAGGTTSTSTAPPGIPYQAEVRNESGEVLANANVNVRFTLHEQTANGTVSYQETHTVTTNELGLFAATIGAGTATQGTFAGINWSQTTKFLQVEVDTGNGYITLGNQQLMSVPYALYAANGPAGPMGPVGPQGPSGLDGQPGANGANGMSAYEIWLAQGNSGSQQDFINNLTISSGSFIGQMNYWNGSEWIPVPVGNDGDVLSLQNGIPTWKPIIAAPAPLFTIGDGAQDIDGNNYKTIIIGNQEWFSENLKTTRYNNGDAIQYGSDSLLWTTTQSGSYAFYNNDGALDSIYGKWYNRYAVKDARSICPVGWHVPNDQEWSTLIFQLGGGSVAGGKMKALTTWNWPNLGADNASGFTGLASGVHYGGTNGWGMGMIARWWSSTEFNLSTAYYKGLGYNTYGIEEYYINNWNAGLNVRCLKN